MSSTEITRAAYRESGHILYAYLHGYAVEFVKLMVGKPGAGLTYVNYGQDQLLVKAITNPHSYYRLYQSFEAEIRERSPGVAHKVAGILMAGSAAECTYLNGGKVKGVMSMQLTGRELEGIRNLHFFLSNIHQTFDAEFVNKKMGAILSAMAIKEIWTPLKILARKILRERSKYLAREDIEAVLHGTRYFDFVESYTAKN